MQLKDPVEIFAMCIEKCRNKREVLAGDETISGGGGGGRSKKRQRQGHEDGPLKWDEGIMQQAEGFDRAHKQVLLKPPSESLWCPVGVADSRSASRAVSDQDNDADADADAREDADAASAGEGSSSSYDTSDEEDDDEEDAGRNGFVARYRKGRTSSGWGQRRYLDEEDEGEGEGSEVDGLLSSSQYLAPVKDLPFPVRLTAPVSTDTVPIERSPIAIQIDPVTVSKRCRTSGRGDSMAALTRPASVMLDSL